MRSHLPGWLVLFVLLGAALYAIAEDLTLTTYYPSPRGVYQSLRTINDLTVGTRVSKGVLTVAGETVHTEFSECPAGYDWYDENGNGVKDFEGECKRTGLLVISAGTAIQVPRVTHTTELQDVPTPAEGMLAYDLEAHQLKIYGGSSWEAIGGTSGAVVFDTAGTYTFIVPDGVTAVTVELWGGGGAGGYGSCGGTGAGGGGGGGGYGKGQLTVTPHSTYQVVVGAGGPPPSTCTGTAAESGRASSISPYGSTTLLLTASGGHGGYGALNVAMGPSGAGGAGGTSSAPTNISGQSGETGGTYNVDMCDASSPIGYKTKGGGGGGGGAGGPPKSYDCSGGSGNGNPPGGGAAGSAGSAGGAGMGAPGRVIISW